MKKVILFITCISKKLFSSNWIKYFSENSLKSTLALVIIVVFWSFPSYDIAIVKSEMDENWSAIFLQVDEPFKNHNNLHSYGSHGEKLAFRFVPALLLKVLSIHSLIPALIFQFAGLLLFYYLLTNIFYSLFKDRVKSFLYALPICFVISGHVYASDYRGIFDTIALDFMLLALIVRSRKYIVIPLLLAYFTDERALISSSSFILIGLFENNKYESFKSILNGLLIPQNMYIIISWVFYFTIRLGLGELYELQTGVGRVNLFFDQISMTFYSLYIGFEGFILPLILVCILLYKKSIYSFVFLIIGSYLMLFFIAQSVLDINRSMSYSLLLIILILMMVDKFFLEHKASNLVVAVICINLVYDDFYPLLLQLYRMIAISETL
jgi:hypothetical protein